MPTTCERVRHRGHGLAVLLAVALAAALAVLDVAAAPETPAARPTPIAESEESEGADASSIAAIPEDQLSGRDIYTRVLENRFDSYVQSSLLVSGDKGGNDQEMRLQMWFKDFRDDQDRAADGELLSKTMVKYTHPYELRHSGYLIIHNLQRPNDQFLYRNSHRRVQRVNLRGEAVFGTDFSFEDIVPRELEDAEYTRGPDETLDDVPCFVIDAIPNDITDSEYSLFRLYVSKAHFVPLRTRYWDDREIEVKELHADPRSIEKLDHVWLARRLIMRNLRHESFTRLEVTELTPNPALGEDTFDLRRLESH